ncbi:unnamed protein product [Phaedon cochleariae]|uniref:Uncharacterized protein n=1 Tax=Phaedon cochleariae TaxID=80249 RepID=A0A9N9SE91_PHACE|nr:unnamed protein product [Phaedon cochleariae]
MGNTSSSRFDEQTDDDVWWPNSGQADPNPVEPEADASEPSQREFRDEIDFQLEMERIREKRKNIIGKKRKEMEDLREEVAKLKQENAELKKNNLPAVGTLDEETKLLRRQNADLRDILEEKSRLLCESETLLEKNRELRISIAEMQEQMQHLNAEVVNFEQEREDYRAHVVALKDVISVSKHMLKIRESQLKELKEKVDSIEKTLSDRETQVLSQELRNEYERQLANIRNLRTLYEERQRMERREKADLMSTMEDVKKELEEEQKKNGELDTRIIELETENSTKYDTIKTLESNLGLSKAECRQFKSELSVINQLFSEILLGFNSSQVIDLDKLQKHLEDHHDLLQDIVVNEISSEVSYALPKVLLDLLNQVSGEKSKPRHLETIQEEQDSASSIHQQMNSAEEIVENLPKVWRVLIELLSHQTAPTNTLSSSEDKENPCYKTVDTPKGPSPVLSVSRTFIRLKDLILEKKSLEKETNHLKQLNGHLENRLQDQEKRLELVHSELSKTWLVVGTLQKQHQMLHTQEKILRYELAQKRKLLNELKEELEESREKWAQARAKNSNTEQQWRLLRTEFASRKNTVLSEEYNNSGESGYSDDREGLSSDEEPGYETDISECAQKLTEEEKSDLDKLHEKIEDGASFLESSEAEGSGMQASTSKDCNLKSPKEGSILLDNPADANGGAESTQEITEESEIDWLRPTTSTEASEITNETYGKPSKDTQKSLEFLESSSLRDNNQENTPKDDSNCTQKITDENEEANEESTKEISNEVAEVKSDQAISLQEDESDECAQKIASDCIDRSVSNHESVSFEKDGSNECAQKITSGCNDRSVSNHEPVSFEEDKSNKCDQKITSDCKEMSVLNQESASFEKDESNACSQKITSDCNDRSLRNHECIGLLQNVQSCSSIDLKTEEVETDDKVKQSSIAPEYAKETLEGPFLQTGDSNGTAQKITSVEKEKANYESAISEREMSGVKTNESSIASECIQGPSNGTLSLRIPGECSQEISSTRRVKNNESVGLMKQINSVDRNSCSSEDPMRTDETEEPTATVEADSASAIQGGQKLTLEEVLARRDERLRRMEGQASQLVSKVASTAIRSVAISNRLDDLHEVYGQSVESSGENIDNDDDSFQTENSQNNEGVD